MELKRLERRIDELESRLAWHEQTIDVLNSAIAEQAVAIMRMEEQIRLLSQRLQQQQVDPGLNVTAQEPPPHY